MSYAYHRHKTESLFLHSWYRSRAQTPFPCLMAGWKRSLGFKYF